MSFSFPTISDLSANLLSISVVSGIIIPIVACIVALVKIRNTVAPLLYGIALYIVTQLFIVNTAGNLFLSITGLSEQYTNGVLWVTLIILFITSLCEESARFICLAYLMKSYRKNNDGFMFGLGYSTATMLFVSAISFFNSLLTVTAINSGAVSEYDAATQQAFYDAALVLSNTTPIQFITPFFDQLALSIVSICLAVLMLKGINANNPKILAITIAVRTFFVCVPSILSALWSWGYLLSTLLLILIAAVAVWYMVKNKEKNPNVPNFRTI